MKYVGSKRKLAAKLLSVILKRRSVNQCYYEPFVGGANMIDKVDGYRIGSDVHTELIALLQAIQLGWQPPTNVSKEEYLAVKTNPKNYQPELVAFIGYLCSFGGKWWGGYANDPKGGRNYAQEAARNLQKQASNLKGIEFRNCNYLCAQIPPNSIVYCDPPYEVTGTTNPYSTGRFDSSEFWEECRQWAKQGHSVFVSEYAAPSDFECMLELAYKTSLDKARTSDKMKRVEKLFTIKGG